MAYSTVAPSIESLLKLAPEDPESWVLGSNPKVNRIARHVERAADVECTVLVSGETGTGKELWARLLHRLGPRRDKPFVPVNCAALTATLAESQLFGHEKGAFTGAAGRSLGVFRAAEGGIVFLDEVGEMPLELQPKLLRVLQQHEVTPVGSSMPAHVDVQVVAATNRDLEVGSRRRPLPRRLVLSLEHGRVPRAAAAAARGRYSAIRRVFLAQVRGPLSAAVVAAHERNAAGILRISLARQCSPIGEHHRAGVRARLRAAAARAVRTRGDRPKRRCRSWTWANCAAPPCGKRCEPRAATRAGRLACWACIPIR